MEIENDARLVLGVTGTSTLFPTGYVDVNIDLHEAGQTRYNSSVAQVISSEPDYGRLYLTNTNSDPALVNKTLDGLIIVNDLIFIDEFNHLIDDGNQITGGAGAAEVLEMQPNSQMTLGNASSATTFPTNHTNYDIRETSTIIYNSGLDQDIESIAGAGNARYSKLIVTNAAGVGTPTKALIGDIIVRGNITINTDNIVDVDATGDYDITLLGNWTNSGTFTRQEGDVIFTGSATQTITSGGTAENFYNYTVQNTSAGGVVIEDDISVSNLLTFTDGIIYEGSGGNEVVIFEVGGNVTGANDASHFDGRVEKIGSIAFDFPVGKNDLYRRISIGVPTVAGTGFRAEYFQVDPDPTFDDSSLDPSLDHVSSCEYWILDQTTGSGDATVTLTWSSVTSCGVDNLPDLRVARWDGAVWRDEGNGGTTGVAAAGDIISGAAVTAFSPFTLASISSSNPLPIELLEFNALLNANDDVELTWTTKSETNNDCFTIERSIDGIYFEPLFDIDGTGNSSIELNYSELDRNPLTGVSYYRLKQTDFDGNYSYSEIRTISRDTKDIVIYPNPSEGGQLWYSLPKEFESYSITVHDATGKTVAQHFDLNQMNGMLSFDLGSGIYLVTFSSENSAQTSRWVIK